MKRMNDELLQQLKKYESKWVALYGSGVEMQVVAVGEDAGEASDRASQKSYPETTLLKVHPADAVYVTLA
jgi:uncharacterized protein DUF5678